MLLLGVFSAWKRHPPVGRQLSVRSSVFGVSLGKTRFQKRRAQKRTNSCGVTQAISLDRRVIGVLPLVPYHYCCLHPHHTIFTIFVAVLPCTTPPQQHALCL